MTQIEKIFWIMSYSSRPGLMQDCAIRATEELERLKKVKEVDFNLNTMESKEIIEQTLRYKTAAILAEIFKEEEE